MLRYKTEQNAKDVIKMNEPMVINREKNERNEKKKHKTKL